MREIFCTASYYKYQQFHTSFFDFQMKSKMAAGGRHLGFSFNACSSGTVSDNCVKFFVQLPIISINNSHTSFFGFQMKSKMAAGSVTVPELEAMKISNMAATRHFEMRKTKNLGIEIG